MALARRSCGSRLRDGGHSSHVAPRSCNEREKPCTTVQYPFVRHMPVTTCATARARGKLACLPTSRDTASAVALARRPRGSRLGVIGHSLHVAPRSCTEREKPPTGAGPFRSTGANINQRSMARARQARVLACFATSRDTASAVALASVPRDCRLHVGGHSSHVAPRSCTVIERPSAGAVPLYSTYTDHSQRSAARTRGKLTCFATSRETASAVALACRPRESRLCAGGHSSYVESTVSHRMREAFRWCSALLWWVYQSQPAQHGAHAVSSRMFCHLPVGTQTALSLTRLNTRLPSTLTGWRALQVDRRWERKG